MGKIIGVVIGAIFGVVLFIIIIAIFVWGYVRNSKRQQQTTQQTTVTGEYSCTKRFSQWWKNYLAEINSKRPRKVEIVIQIQNISFLWSTAAKEWNSLLISPIIIWLPWSAKKQRYQEGHVAPTLLFTRWQVMHCIVWSANPHVSNRIKFRSSFSSIFFSISFQFLFIFFSFSFHRMPIYINDEILPFLYTAPQDHNQWHKLPLQHKLIHNRDNDN